MNVPGMMRYNSEDALTDLSTTAQSWKCGARERTLSSTAGYVNDL